MNMTDHYTTYVYITPLNAKSADEVLTTAIPMVFQTNPNQQW